MRLNVEATIGFFLCLTKTFCWCNDLKLDEKDQYQKIRKLVAQKSLLENDPRSNPTTRLFNWDKIPVSLLSQSFLPTTPSTLSNATLELFDNLTKSNLDVENQKPKLGKRKRQKYKITNDVEVTTKRIKKRNKKKCNKRKNKNGRRCRNKRKKNKLNNSNILEITTAKYKNIFPLNAENNATLKELIAKLNENPENDYTQLLPSRRKSLSNLTTTIENNDFFSTKLSYGLKITLDNNPLASLTTTTEKNSNNLKKHQDNKIFDKNQTGFSIMSTNFTLESLLDDLNTINNDLGVVFPAYKNRNRKKRCKDRKGGCAHICHEDGPKLCSCLNGFILASDFKNCIDIDECSYNNGGCEKFCHNTLGSYYCSCPEGLRLSDDYKTCEDINECLLRNGHGPCQDICENIFGSYKCGCSGLNGTRLAEDRHTCEDINECAEDVAGCSHNCINTLGRAFCTCPDGWELGLNWKTCYDVDECKDFDRQKECPYGCTNTLGSYHCFNPYDFQNDQSVNETPDHIVCSPLFPPTHGFLNCSREKAVAVKLRTRSGRTRITNRPGTFCHLVCPFGFKSVGEYILSCDVDGKWKGTSAGKCIPFTKPSIRCPSNQIHFLGKEQSTAVVKIPRPKTNINWKYVKSHPEWAKNLQATLSRGRHRVTFTASDPRSKLISTCTFNIVVDP